MSRSGHTLKLFSLVPLQDFLPGPRSTIWAKVLSNAGSFFYIWIGTNTIQAFIWFLESHIFNQELLRYLSPYILSCKKCCFLRFSTAFFMIFQNCHIFYVQEVESFAKFCTFLVSFVLQRIVDFVTCCERFCHKVSCVLFQKGSS